MIDMYFFHETVIEADIECNDCTKQELREASFEWTIFKTDGNGQVIEIPHSQWNTELTSGNIEVT